MIMQKAERKRGFERRAVKNSIRGKIAGSYIRGKIVKV
jgi:hypothetical protein